MHKRNVGRWSTVLGAVAAVLLGTSHARAEYRLSPGDTLELSIAGAPDLKFRAPIGVDGTTVFPLVGSMPASGQTLAELRRSVQKELGSRVYRRTGDAGQEKLIVISPDEITLTVAEYRPVVATGDVSKPGEQPYRPGMTVRHVVAAAGGYDFMRFRMENPFMTQSDLKSEYEALWIAFAKDQSTVERLEAELKNAADLQSKTRIETPLTEQMTKRMAETEAAQLSLRNALHNAEIDYLKGTVAKETSRLALLSRQEQNERNGADADADEVGRLEGLFAKGAVPITRVVDARRAMLLSSTRLLQTIGEQARVERERDAMAHKLAVLGEQRRLAVLGELQQAETKLATTRAKLQAAGDKLAYAGMLRSHLVNGKAGSAPDVVIFRKTDGKREAVPSSEDDELLPGDVVEITLKQFLPGSDLSHQASSRP